MMAGGFGWGYQGGSEANANVAVAGGAGQSLLSQMGREMLVIERLA